MNEVAGRESRVSDRQVIDMMLAHICFGFSARFAPTVRPAFQT